jgi:putative ABC transport system permease protein
VVLGHAFWLDRLGGERSVVGQTLRLNGEAYQVVGVMPRHFPLPLRDIDVIVPLAPDLDPRRHVRSSTNFLRLFGRLRGPTSLPVAQRELSAINADLRAEHPNDYATKLGARATPMQEYLVGGTRQTLLVMLGAAALLLGIAMANVLNLLLIRGIGRQGEMAVRRALGASTRHLFFAVVSEAAWLATAGAIAGAVLARWSVSLVAGSSIDVPRLDEAQVEVRTLLFVMGVSVMATLLFSVIPLFAAMRSAPRAALAAIGRGQQGGRGQARLRAAFTVVQLAFAVLLTVVTATMATSLAGLRRVELGFRPDSVYVARVAMPPHRYGTVSAVARFAEELEQALRTAPGVVSAGAVSIAPLSGQLYTVPFTVVGRPPADDRDRPNANLRAISPGYLRAIGASLVSGRELAPSDNEGSARVAIVSRALAERHLAGVDPIGQQLLIDDNNDGPRPISIVGVVENMRHVDIDGPPALDVFIPISQFHPHGLSFLAGSQFWTVRLAAAGTSYPSTFVRTLEQIDRDVAAAQVRPMQAYIDDDLAPRTFSVSSLLGFAGLALVLATIGVYGVVAYSVEQRRREIGLRLALGATGGNVARSVIQPAVRLALLGVGIGIAGALLARQAVAGLLFGVTPTEPVILGVVSAALVLTSALAAAIPARRAATIDPVIALAGD